MKIDLKQIGRSSFGLGTFFLASAPAISILFIIISIIISSLKRKKNYFNDQWNYPFFISGLLMIICCLTEQLKSSNEKLEYLNSINSWIGLANWIPLFFCFWALQPYLILKEDRRRCALYFICGCVPVLITGFGQYWFNWYGPFELFNGLIIWFQRPIISNGGLSGLFNNANYAGALLTMVLPFVLAASYQKNLSLIKRTIVIIINMMVIIAIVLTNSRNAWLGLFISIPLLIGSFRFLISTFSGISIIFASIKLYDWLKEFLISFLPAIWIDNFDISLITSDARVLIFKNSIKYIIERPFLGHGGSGFGEIYRFRSQCTFGYCYDHSHNLPMELALKYGVITSIVISSSVGILVYLGYKKITFKDNNIKYSFSENLFDKAWVVSAIIILTSHMVDIQYFDIRISLFSWILLAGIKELIMEENKFKKIAFKE